MTEKDHLEKDANDPENKAVKHKDSVDVKKEKKRIRVELIVKGNEKKPRNKNPQLLEDNNKLYPIDRKSMDCEVMCDQPFLFPVSVPTMAEVNAAILAAPAGVVPAAVAANTAAVAANTAALAALAGVPAALAANTAALAAFAGVPAAVAANTAAVAANTAALAALAGVPAALAGINVALDSLRDGIALANNRGCSGNDHPLSARVIAGVGPPPAGFPATVRDLVAMPGPQVNMFLNHWQIHPNHGTLKERRHCLGTFLGIPSHFL